MSKILLKNLLSIVLFSSLFIIYKNIFHLELKFDWNFIGYVLVIIGYFVTLNIYWLNTHYRPIRVEYKIKGAGNLKIYLDFEITNKSNFDILITDIVINGYVHMGENLIKISKKSTNSFTIKFELFNSTPNKYLTVKYKYLGTTKRLTFKKLLDA